LIKSSRFGDNMTKTERGFGSGVAYVLFANLGWSLSGTFVRLMPDLNFWQINCWRGYWSAIALLAYLLIAYGDRASSKFKEIPLPALVSSALFFAVGTTLYVLSLTKVSTATVSVIGATSPLVTGLLSFWITGEKPKVLAWAAAVLALAGMFVIYRDGEQRGEFGWLLVCLGVPITFALQTLLLRRYRGYDMMPAICIGGFLMFISCGFFSFFAGGIENAFTLNLKNMLLLLLMGPVQLAIPLIFYGMGARTVSAITLSLLAMMDAVINPFWSWLFVGEMPQRLAVIGGGIILCAVLLSIIGERLFGSGARAP
jgi:drug/metabolite transporter (DMT)-like permease